MPGSCLKGKFQTKSSYDTIKILAQISYTNSLNLLVREALVLLFSQPCFECYVQTIRTQIAMTLDFIFKSVVGAFVQVDFILGRFPPAPYLLHQDKEIHHSSHAFSGFHQIQLFPACTLLKAREDSRSLGTSFSCSIRQRSS